MKGRKNFKKKRLEVHIGKKNAMFSSHVDKDQIKKIPLNCLLSRSWGKFNLMHNL